MALQYASPHVFQLALTKALLDEHHYVHAAAESIRAAREIEGSIALFRPSDVEQLRNSLNKIESTLGPQARRRATLFAEQYAARLFQHVHHEIARVLNNTSLT